MLQNHCSLACTLSHSDQVDNSNCKKFEPTLNSLNEKFALNNKDVLHFPTFETIMRLQQKKKCLVQIDEEQQIQEIYDPN